MFSLGELSVPAGVDQFAHADGQSHHKLFDDGGCDATAAIGLATEAEGELPSATRHEWGRRCPESSSGAVH